MNPVVFLFSTAFFGLATFIVFYLGGKLLNRLNAARRPIPATIRQVKAVQVASVASVLATLVFVVGTLVYVFNYVK